MINNTEFKTRLYTAIDDFTQKAIGDDVDTLIYNISTTKFNELAKVHKKDQVDKKKFKQIKKLLIVGSVALAVSAVVAALASILFSAGTVAAGSLVLAAVSGVVSITASFKQLDSAIENYIAYRTAENGNKTRIDRLKQKITNIEILIKKRMDDLPKIDKKIQEERAGEILNQIEKINGYIEKIKKAIPQKIMEFQPIDPSRLLTATT